MYSCPPLGEEMVGTCAEECRGDEDCTAPFKCCSNGCGHVCTQPTLTPYYPPPYECHAPNNDVAGICVEDCNNNTLCPSGYQCCSNGCGHTCVSLCNLIEFKLANQTLLGAYQPQCEDEGSFSEVQCHGSTGYCWCVDPVSGRPRSELTRGEELQCSCSYAGETRTVGEVFIASDGFNSCTCTITGVHCTEHKVFHSCPAVREEEEAGICVAECTLDSECSPGTKCCYTGCGYSCMTPEIVPYIPIPILDTCPPTDQVPCAQTLGSCEEEESEFACDTDTSLCCENDCSSSVCVYRTGPIPCKNARKISQEGNGTLVGVFSPQCDFDGYFKSIQCQEHFCWCVDPRTGKPESDMVAFENIDSLLCTNCVYEGRKYGFLEEFPAGDGCNTCTCVYDGAISCSEVGCEVPTGRDDSKLWKQWHSVLIYCVVTVVVLTLLVLILLVVVLVTMKKNKFRHKKLKEAATVHFESDMDAVYFKQGQDLNTVELKVPVEDVDTETDHKA